MTVLNGQNGHAVPGARLWMPMGDKRLQRPAMTAVPMVRGKDRLQVLLNVGAGGDDLAETGLSSFGVIDENAGRPSSLALKVSK